MSRAWEKLEGREDCYPSLKLIFVVIQSLGGVHLFVTPWTTAHQASLFFIISQEFAQVHVHWISDAIQPSHPLSSPSSSCLQPFPASGSFPVSSLHQVVKVLDLQFQHQSFQEYSGLISFRIDWFDLLAVQHMTSYIIILLYFKRSLFYLGAYVWKTINL